MGQGAETTGKSESERGIRALRGRDQTKGKHREGGMKGGSRKEKKTGEERFKASCPTPRFFPFFVSSSDIFFCSCHSDKVVLKSLYIFLFQYFLQEIAMLVKSFFTLCNKTDLNI